MRGNGSIFKRGNVLWMKYYRDGVPVSISCKTASKEVAKSLLKAELRKSDDEFTEPRYKRVTVADLFDLFATYCETNGLSDYRKRAMASWTNHMKPVFGNMKATQFDSQAQHNYRKQRLAAGTAPATINREIQILISCFKLGYEQQPPLVKRLPKFHLTKEDNARKVFCNATEVVALKEAAAKHSLEMRVFLEIAVLFGWRRGEVHKLRVNNIHLSENTIRIEDSKNGDAREVTMMPGLRLLIEALVVGKQPTDALFPFSEQTLNTYWGKIAKAANCPHIHIHDLRRTSARTKRAAGVDTSVTMAIMGWRSEAMFRRYGIVAKEDKQVALAKQEAYEHQIGGVN